MQTVRLKPGREKSLYRRHPWVFSGAVEEGETHPGEGETVQVVDAKGQFLAWGAYSPNSQIRIRIWSWKKDEKIDGEFFQTRLLQAFQRRQMLGERTDAFRLVHGESDGLPGLVVDRYADFLVVQFLSCGPENFRTLLVDLLKEISGAKGIYERSDVDVRHLEGLQERTGLLCGSEPPEFLSIFENGVEFWVDVRKGHKTGFYSDQRENRLRLRSLAAGRSVLDCFCYTGGFTINALSGGAEQVLAVDSSTDALEQGQNHVRINHLPGERVEWMEGDVFQVLRGLRDRGRKFDLVILDPPKFAPTAAQAERAARGYKDINLLAFKLLRPNGLLVTFSCSGGVDFDLFQKIVAGAALDAGVEGQIIERLSQAPDHPVALNFPEGAYLKGLVVRAANE